MRVRLCVRVSECKCVNFETEFCVLVTYLIHRGKGGDNNSKNLFLARLGRVSSRLSEARAKKLGLVVDVPIYRLIDK